MPKSSCMYIVDALRHVPPIRMENTGIFNDFPDHLFCFCLHEGRAGVADFMIFCFDFCLYVFFIVVDESFGHR